MASQLKNFFSLFDCTIQNALKRTCVCNKLLVQLTCNLQFTPCIQVQMGGTIKHLKHLKVLERQNHAISRIMDPQIFKSPLNTKAWQKA